MNSLPDSYNEAKTTIKYGRDNLNMDIVLSALRSKDLEIKKHKGKATDQALVARGR